MSLQRHGCTTQTATRARSLGGGAARWRVGGCCPCLPFRATERANDGRWRLWKDRSRSEPVG